MRDRNGTAYWQEKRAEQKAQKAQKEQEKQRSFLQKLEEYNRLEVEEEEDNASWMLHRHQQKLASDHHAERAAHRTAIQEQLTMLPTQQETAATKITSEEAAEREVLLKKIEQQKFVQKFVAQIFQNVTEKASMLKEAADKKAAHVSQEARTMGLFPQRATADEPTKSRERAAERARAYEERQRNARKKPEALAVAVTGPRTASPGDNFVVVESPVKNGGFFHPETKHADPQPASKKEDTRSYFNPTRLLW